MQPNDELDITPEIEEEDVDFLQEMENLLDEHDYEIPQVGDIRMGTIVSVSSQGIIVDLGVKRDGIVQPADVSKLDAAERDKLAAGDEVPVYILSTDEPDGLQVSLFRAKLNEDWIKAQEIMSSGEIFRAKITGHNRGGVIVPFGRLRGFVPASHLTSISRSMNDTQRMEKLIEMKDEEIPLKVIEVERRRRRLVLSQREAQKEWEEARRSELLEKLEEGQTIRGRVSGMRDFGAFVDLGGADGLVHISELAWHRVNHPREVLKVGDEIDVYVLKLDKKEQRISLSRKKILPNPWSLVEQKYAVGDLVEGRITRIVTYGGFVEVEPGVEGLLHTSQLARSKVDDPREIIHEGETHLLRVVSIDPDRQRMGLSLKAVTPTEQIEWMSQRGIEEVDAEALADETPAEDVPVDETPADDAPAVVTSEAVDDSVLASVDAVTAVDEEE